MQEIIVAVILLIALVATVRYICNIFSGKGGCDCGCEQSKCSKEHK